MCKCTVDINIPGHDSRVKLSDHLITLHTQLPEHVNSPVYSQVYISLPLHYTSLDHMVQEDIFFEDGILTLQATASRIKQIEKRTDFIDKARCSSGKG